MRSHVLILLIVAFFTAAVCVTGAVDAKGTLTVDNPTDNPAQIEVWRYNGMYWQWVPVVTLAPHHRVPISPVGAGDRFRARLQGQSEPQLYTVTLKDGLQESWTLQLRHPPSQAMR